VRSTAATRHPAHKRSTHGTERGQRVVVVTWTRDNARSRDVACLLGGEVVHMPWAVPHLPLHRRLAGWTRSARATRRVLVQMAPGSVVVAMGPPAFNVLLCCLLGPRLGVRVVVDAHSGVWNDAAWAWSRRLVDNALRRADLLLVTDPAILSLCSAPTALVRSIEEHTAVADAGGVPTMPLHDPLPPAGSRREHRPRERPLVVYPASGASDEPVAAVDGAADLLAGEADVVITGRTPPTSSSGARRTGFLADAEYRELLGEAAVVLALTLREATMQRAAYEALALGTPIVSSDTRVLRSWLVGAAEFTGPEPQSIAAAVRRALGASQSLSAGSVAVRARMQHDQREVRSVVAALTGGGGRAATGARGAAR
jgi:glycosyltransferase involved in cell wall biosynthesis